MNQIIDNYLTTKENKILINPDDSEDLELEHTKKPIKKKKNNTPVQYI